MSNKIPTAEEFLDNYSLDQNTIINRLQEFAKLHVEAALKDASEKAIARDTINNPYIREGDLIVDEDSILNAYPLENIK